MRSSFDTLDLEAKIGERGNTLVTTANRGLVQNWLLSQGLPSLAVKKMQLKTLYKAYNKPAYLAAVLHNRGEQVDDGCDDAAIAGPSPDGYSPQAVAPAVPTVPDLPLWHTPADRSEALVQIGNAISVLAGDAINEARVIELIKEHAPRNVQTLEVNNVALGTVIPLGIQHRSFPKLLKLAQVKLPAGDSYRRLNIWLRGPAGSGKTSGAENLAKALGLPFHFTGAIDSEYKLLGFIDANGKVISKPFRKAYEKGGVFLFDEVDRSFPGAMMAFQAALANGYCDFPDGPIKRHPDCIILAAANTNGLGSGDGVYSAAMKQDAAFLDRFRPIDWDYDEDMERQLTANDDWCDYVQLIRRRVKEKGTKVIVSPRASIEGAAMLAHGFELDDVKAMTVRAGMSDAQWSAVQ